MESAICRKLTLAVFQIPVIKLMPSSLNTEALRTLLESDLLTLEDLLESLNLSSDDLIASLSDLLSDEIAPELIETLQAFYETSVGTSTPGSATGQTIQTLIETVNRQPTVLEDLAIAFKGLLSKPSAQTAVFAFANSIFTNERGGDRIQSLLGQAAETYRSFIPPNAAAFTTISRNGQRVNNGSVDPLKWSTSSNGQTNVTFAFDDSFGVNGLSVSRAKELFVSALSVWSQYAPLNFQEIEDPGSTSQVDILVQSDRIDGAGRTLAFAYFPTFGDITFDNEESWTDSKFLETSTHELGHSLGLDHESDVAAILNPVLDNKFEGRDTPFLLEDDINGIRSLYGSGSGTVSTLGKGVSPPTTAPVNLPANNLVVNGSFEDTPVQANSSRVYSRVKGWDIFSGTGFRIDRRTQEFGGAADGTAIAELDVFGKNSTIYQNVDSITGQSYTLSVDFTSGGRNQPSTEIDVFWAGQRLDRLTGGGRGNWKNYQFNVEGAAGRNSSTLAFRAVGAVDSVGGLIDNVSVIARANATAPSDSGGRYHCHCSHCQGHGSHSRAMGSNALRQPSLIEMASSADFAPDLVIEEQPDVFPDASVLA